VKVNGIVDVTIGTAATMYNEKTLENEALIAAERTYGKDFTLSETFDMVMFCQPPGTGSWVAYAYVNDWRSYYNDFWCQRVSSQMHEIGHNMNLAHSGLPGLSEYGDKSGMMGYSYNEDDGPKKCFNAAKSYQLGWYAKQISSIDPLDYISDPQSFVLNGVADYKKDGSNGESLVSLRLEDQGLHGGIDYYIGYNRRTGITDGVLGAPNCVTLTEKENPYYTVQGRNGYGKSLRIAALKAGESTTLQNYGSSNYDVTLTVDAIDGKDAFITITAIEPQPTSAPTSCYGNRLKIELGTDNFGSETKWSIRDRESNEVLAENSDGYGGSKVYELPTPGSSFCLTPGRCYTFQITDEFGDGMCCEYGEGYFRGILDGSQIFEGGEFMSEESIEFCTPHDDDEDDDNLNVIPTKTPTIAPTMEPTLSPSLSPTSTPSVEPTSSPSVEPTNAGNQDRTKVPTSSPTTFPTVNYLDSPSKQCVDDRTFRFRKKDRKDCRWVKKGSRKRTRKICKKKSTNEIKVFKRCKEACGKVGLGPCAEKKNENFRKHDAGSTN